jgi:hypothetical protein
MLCLLSFVSQPGGYPLEGELPLLPLRYPPRCRETDLNCRLPDFQSGALPG